MTSETTGHQLTHYASYVQLVHVIQWIVAPKTEANVPHKVVACVRGDPIEHPP